MSTTTPRPPRPDSPPPWYRVPFVWFVIALLVLVVASAVHLIVLSFQVQDDSVLDPAHAPAFKVPALPARPAAEDAQP